MLSAAQYVLEQSELLEQGQAKSSGAAPQDELQALVTQLPVRHSVSSSQ